MISAPVLTTAIKEELVDEEGKLVEVSQVYQSFNPNFTISGQQINYVGLGFNTLVGRSSQTRRTS